LGKNRKAEHSSHKMDIYAHTCCDNQGIMELDIRKMSLHSVFLDTILFHTFLLHMLDISVQDKKRIVAYNCNIPVAVAVVVVVVVGVMVGVVMVVDS